MKNLTEIDVAQLEILAKGKNLYGSLREEDRSRTKLKSAGLIIFDRPSWRWSITDAGRAALSKARGETR